MSHAGRRRLKALLPQHAHAPLRRAASYAARLRRWMEVVSEIKGVSSGDRRALRRCLMLAPLTSAHDLDAWQNPYADRDLLVDVVDVGRFKIRGNSDDLVHVSPSREPAIVAAIKRLLLPGDLFIDAGANLGFYSVLAARLVGPTGHVVAIEMMPDTATMLRDHIAMNGLANVTLVERALSDVSGEAVTASVRDGEFGQASIATGLASADKTTVTVETTTLAEIVQRFGPAKLMKMDLEGVELRVLKGAGAALGRIEHIICEDWGGEGGSHDWSGSGHQASALDARNFIASRPRAGGTGAA
jgi:FkbM family methyltransferase